MKTLIAIALLLMIVYAIPSPGASAVDRICFYCNRTISNGDQSTSSTSLQTGKKVFYHYDCYPEDPYNCPECVNCTMVTSEENLSNAKGLPLCRYCEPFSITDDRQIANILVDIRYTCHKKLGILSYNKPEFHILDYVAFHKRFGSNMAFVDYRRDDNPQYVGVITRIYVVRGYSSIVYYHYLTHEYAHAWSADYPDISGEVREGFGEWLSYTLCKIKNIQPIVTHYEESLHDEQYTSTPYGAGLIMFIEAERRGGIGAVLELAKSTDK